MFFELWIWILLGFSGKKCSQRQHNAFSVCSVRRLSSAPVCLNFEFTQEKGQLECHPLTCSFSLWSFNFPCSNCPEASWHQGVLWNILAFHGKKKLLYDIWDFDLQMPMLWFRFRLLWIKFLDLIWIPSIAKSPALPTTTRLPTRKLKLVCTGDFWNV